MSAKLTEFKSFISPSRSTIRKYEFKTWLDCIRFAQYWDIPVTHILENHSKPALFIH